MKKPYHLDTSLIHYHGKQGNEYGALVAPIYQTSTFSFENLEQGSKRFAGEEEGYIYTRLGNPTVRALERQMAALEGSEDAAAAATGMGAVSAALLSNLQAGDHIVAASAVYGCTFSLLNEQFPRYGIEVSFVDMADFTAVAQAMKSNTKVMFFETPVNPHLQVFDIKRLTAIAREHDVISIVDNTFLTPMLQRPLELGADVVIHSATKYLNGHGDVVAGIICSSQSQIDNVKGTILKDFGASLAPFDAWLISRGLKTLAIRMERHCQSALTIASWLEAHDGVTNVYYPGLNDECGEALLGSQMLSGGGLVAIELNANFEQTCAFVDMLKLFTIAVSLGDAESLVQHPASMTHATYSEDERNKAGISGNLIRLSIGLEAPQDLINDLEYGLNALNDLMGDQLDLYQQA